MDLPPNGSMRSLAEEETVLPCHYQPSGNDVVVQVTWYKEKSDGTKEQIILAHHINGQTGQLTLWLLWHLCSNYGHSTASSSATH